MHKQQANTGIVLCTKNKIIQPIVSTHHTAPFSSPTPPPPPPTLTNIESHDANTTQAATTRADVITVSADERQYRRSQVKHIHSISESTREQMTV